MTEVRPASVVPAMAKLERSLDLSKQDSCDEPLLGFSCRTDPAVARAAADRSRSPLPRHRSTNTYRLYRAWDEVPDVPPEGSINQPWFLEIFSGTARLTKAMVRSASC